MNQLLPSVSAPPFEVIEPASVRVPVLAHVPHASRVIPPHVRGELLVDDAELEREIVRLTDHDSDDLFAPLSVNRQYPGGNRCAPAPCKLGIKRLGVFADLTNIMHDQGPF